MKRFVIAPQEPVVLPVAGSDSYFPVRRIYCVGRNYADHAVEMGVDPRSDPPFFFQKPVDAILLPGEPFPYPSGSANVHHEVELVVAMGIGGRDIQPADAHRHIFGYAVGLDMTRRDLQLDARAKGRPWDVGKAYDHSAPVGALVPADRCGHPNRGRIQLSINGSVRQSADISEPIWPVPEIVSTLSTLFLLRAGDIIMTGTPAGVGPVLPGDLMDATIEGIWTLRVAVCSPVGTSM